MPSLVHEVHIDMTSIECYTDSPLQKDSVKDGTQQHMASSNPVSGLGIRGHRNTTFFPVPQRGVRALRVCMVFGIS
jgi:hypothetical protein